MRFSCNLRISEIEPSSSACTSILPKTNLDSCAKRSLRFAAIAPAAAVACSFGAGQYKSDLAKKWIKFCKDNIPIGKGRLQHDEYQSYYYAQAIYVLGDDRYGELFPKEDKKTWVTWSGYKEVMFDHLKSQQNQDGSWTSGYIGPVFSTCVNLTILQLDKGIVPIYHR